MPLSFVHVQPGKPTTAASKHKQRVGIHSHAQKVTQQRKREKRLQEVERKSQTALVAAARPASLSSGVLQRLNGARDVNTLIAAVNLTQKYPYGLPTPSPEPDIQIARPLTDYSSWSDDHKYGVGMFIHVTVLDINENATNMNFWKRDVPALTNAWDCIRDIVSAIAAANQAIQDRDSNLILTALELHHKALARLRRDVRILPLSAQVACCLLFDAFNLLRCDFAQAGDQVAIARKLTSNLQLTDYLQDEHLPTVCDALNRMNQISAWSLWNPSNFLRYEGLRHIEPNLHLDFSAVNCTNGVVDGLSESIGRFSKQLSGRVRRNLSERAFIDPSSQFAHDVLQEFRSWKHQLDVFVSESPSSEESATIQQIELAWNFLYIAFTSGVLNQGETVCDDPAYYPRYHRINDLSEQRFNESANSGRGANMKAFMQIIIPTLWLDILWCRDPSIRARSIAILESHHYDEREFNSIVTARIAKAVVDLETGGAQISAAWEVPLDRRICVESIRYRPDIERVVLSYSYPSLRDREDPTFERYIPWELEGDMVKLTSALFALSQVCTLYRKVRPYATSLGCIKPMFYKDKLVPVCVAIPDE